MIDVLFAVVKCGLHPLENYLQLNRAYVDQVFLAPPAAGGSDPARLGDLGERGRGFLSPAAGAILQPRHAVRQHWLFLHLHRGRAGAARAPWQLWCTQREQVSAAHGRCEGPGLECVDTHAS